MSKTPLDPRRSAWYVWQAHSPETEQGGPMTFERLCIYRRTGRIPDHFLIRYREMESWACAGKLLPLDSLDSPQPLQPLPPQQLYRLLNGRYRLHESLRHECSGTVYRASTLSPPHAASPPQLAIQLIPSSLRHNEALWHRLYQDWLRWLSLSHVNLLEVFELAEASEGETYLLLGRYPRWNLAQLLARLHEQQKKIPYSFVAYITNAICQGLAQAHHFPVHDRCGLPGPLLHLHLVAENVLLAEDGAVQLTGFGQHHILPHLDEPDLRAASPEQLAERRLDPRSDLFALGNLLYEMLTGRHPFVHPEANDLIEADGLVGLCGRLREARYPPAHNLRSDLPPLFTRLLTLLLNAAPEQRYKDAHLVRSHLEEWLQEQDPLPTARTLAAWLQQTFAPNKEEDEKEALHSFQQDLEAGLIDSL